METIIFITSLLTFYLKGEIRHQQNFIRIKKPNTILSLIPLGSVNDTIPINQIASVGTNFKLLLKNFVFGLIVAMLGLGSLLDSFLVGLVVTAIGVSMVINAFQVKLSINLTSGATKEVYFLIFEKKKAEQAETQINGLISGRMDDTNNRIQTERQTDVLVDALQNLKR